MGSIETAETFEAIQSIGPRKYLGIAFYRGVGSVSACASAGGFLISTRMRRAVGSEEELGMTANCGFDQAESMCFPFQDWSAIVMWLQSTVKKRIAVK